MSNNNSNNNNRASLLSGLRTGGVRSTSHSGLPIPHTSAIGGFFNVPGGLNSFQQQGMGMGTNAGYYPPEQDDQYDEQPGYHDFNDQHQHQYLAQSQSPPQGRQTMPMTAAVDGPNNRFLSQQQQQQMLLAQQQAQQQQRQGTPGRGGGQGQQGQGQDALQMQMMQLEILKLQVRYVSPSRPLSNVANACFGFAGSPSSTVSSRDPRAGSAYPPSPSPVTSYSTLRLILSPSCYRRTHGHVFRPAGPVASSTSAFRASRTRGGL